MKRKKYLFFSRESLPLFGPFLFFFILRDLFCEICCILEMSYAEAASSGISSSHGSKQGSQQRSRPKYFNEKMVVCMANGVSYDKLTDVLHQEGFWQSVTGFQKVDFNRRYALVIEDANLRDKLVTKGLNVDGKFISESRQVSQNAQESSYLNRQLELAKLT